MKKLTPLQAIYAKCRDCCCGDVAEVHGCTAEGCPLYPFHEKVKRKRVLTEEQKQALVERFKKSMENKKRDI